MRKTTYFCDGCGAAKGEANRWLLGRKFKATFDAVFYGLADWNDAEAEHSEVFCGQQCALKYQDQFLRQDQPSVSRVATDAREEEPRDCISWRAEHQGEVCGSRSGTSRGG
jgi:hypothetical protein